MTVMHVHLQRNTNQNAAEELDEFRPQSDTDDVDACRVAVGDACGGVDHVHTPVDVHKYTKHVCHIQDTCVCRNIERRLLFLAKVIVLLKTTVTRRRKLFY